MKLEQLKKRYFTLDAKVELYLPTRTMKHDAIDADLLAETRQMVGQSMSRYFGGATITRAVGFYENKSLGTSQLEDVEIVYSYCQKLQPDMIHAMIKMAEELRTTLAQESIMLVINGTAVFI